MSNWVQKDAAELLNISPRVMNYKIKTLAIEYPRGRRMVDVACDLPLRRTLTRLDRRGYMAWTRPVASP